MKTTTTFALICSLILLIVLAGSVSAYTYTSAWTNLRDNGNSVVCGGDYPACTNVKLGVDWFKAVENDKSYDLICGEIPEVGRVDCLLHHNAAVGQIVSVPSFDSYYVMLKTWYAYTSPGTNEKMKVGVTKDWTDRSSYQNVADLGSGNKKCVLRDKIYIGNSKTKLFVQGIDESVHPYSYKISDCISQSEVNSGLVYCDNGAKAVADCPVCKPGATQTCSTGKLGVCSAGTQTCSAVGQWGSCMQNTQPSVEVCDNKDNDCDGLVDEDIANITSGTDVGECKIEIKQCKSGIFQTVQFGITPVIEDCDDNKDNDCDGLIDSDDVIDCPTHQCTRDLDCFPLNINSSDYCYTNDVYRDSTIFRCVSFLCQSNPLLRIMIEDCGEDSRVVGANYCQGGNVIRNVTSMDRGCNSASCFANPSFSFETVEECDNGCTNGECNDKVCDDGETRNFLRNNFCSGINVLSSISYEQCFGNAWHYFSFPNQFNRTCSGETSLEDQYCSGSSLYYNWSQPTCALGECGRSYFTNHTSCEYGCNDTIDECNPPTDWPTCSVDYLKGISGNSYNFDLADGLVVNYSGYYSVYGNANANSEDFVLTNIRYNRTSPNFLIYSWEPSAGSSLNPFEWHTSYASDSVAFTDGNHEICCQVASERCDGGLDDCETRTGDVACESFCIDSQGPSVDINTIANMSSWNSSVFNWSWTVSDSGCAGIDYLNVSVADANGTVLRPLSVYVGNSLISYGLVVNHSYVLNVRVVDRAGNIGIDSATVHVIGSGSPINQTNCTERWVCDSWSDCEDDVKTRDCYDANSCGTTNNRPDPFEEKDCNTDDEDDDGCVGNCGGNGGSSVFGNRNGFNLTNDSGIYLGGDMSNASVDINWNWLWFIIALIVLVLLVMLLVRLVR